MKKQYVNPQCEYWCYVGGKLCVPNVPGDVVYGDGDNPTQQIYSSSTN